MKYKVEWTCNENGTSSYNITDSSRAYYFEIIANCELEKDADKIVAALNKKEGE